MALRGEEIPHAPGFIKNDHPRIVTVLDANTRPGVTELPGDEHDQNCDGSETCLGGGRIPLFNLSLLGSDSRPIIPDFSSSRSRLLKMTLVRQSMEIAVRIAENAGYEGSLIAAKLWEEGKANRGFNAANGKYVDMKE